MKVLRVSTHAARACYIESHNSPVDIRTIGAQATVSMANFLEQVTPLIITYNEEANIRRTLSKLTWANKILVVDSGSTDATLDIAKSSDKVEIIHRPFDDCASQWNFGLEHVGTAWVLSLDAIKNIVFQQIPLIA